MVKIFQLALLAGSVAPSIAAGGTVFATAAKRKGEHDQIWLASKTNFTSESFIRMHLVNAL